MARHPVDAYLDRLPETPAGGALLRRIGPGRVAGSFYGAELTSVFQPVVDAERRVAGHAAYVRSHAAGGHDELSPWQVFALAAGDDALVRLDRLCRTVHAINYFASGEPGWRLHLAVEHRLLLAVPTEHGRTFEGVLNGFGVATSRVVIELPQSAMADPALLGGVIANYRHRGYAVSVRAVADAVAISALGYVRPDIVRLRFEPSPRSRLRDAVDAVHAIGARALVEHIETASGRAAAEAAGAELLQGYYLGAPGPDAIARPASGVSPDRIPWLDDSALLIGTAPLL